MIRPVSSTTTRPTDSAPSALLSLADAAWRTSSWRANSSAVDPGIAGSAGSRGTSTGAEIDAGPSSPAGPGAGASSLVLEAAPPDEVRPGNRASDAARAGTVPGGCALMLAQPSHDRGRAPSGSEVPAGHVETYGLRSRLLRRRLRGHRAAVSRDRPCPARGGPTGGSARR